MRIIYKPSWTAGESSILGLNLYMGCTHRCRYCYNPKVLHVDSKAYFAGPKPKQNALERLQEDAKGMAKRDDDRQIFLSFVGDIYQPLKPDVDITRATLEILIDHALTFTVLTKGGRRALRDFDLLAGYPKASFGTSLVFASEKDAAEWEPGAATVKERADVIRIAHERGIPTWVSMEPVIYPDQALALIRALHPVVDHWDVGKLNHMNSPQPVDWVRFREEVTEALEGVGADYNMKTSLTELS